MFDIQEYLNDERHDTEAQTKSLEKDISYDIDRLLKGRFQNLYAHDRYKYGTKNIDIVHPLLTYPGKRSLFMTPDKVRFSLSIHPEKSDFEYIDRIIIRPRYAEVNGIELAAIYLKKSQSMVLYLTHPYTVSQPEEFVLVELPELMRTELAHNPPPKDSKVNINPINRYISIIAHQPKDAAIEKFFLKVNPINDADYQVLLDMSYFYSRHGY
ncbi:MAG: hypothetical protein FWG92_02025 [Leptospirales bacterium]|nr:hypothetical protein [Leptospirales bacterium]